MMIGLGLSLSSGGPAPFPPGVVAKGLQYVMGYQSTAGLSDPGATFSNPTTNAATLTGLGWFVDAGSALIYARTACNLTNWDFTGWQILSGPNGAAAGSAKVYNNCKFGFGAGNKFSLYSSNYLNTATSSWSETFNNCQFDGLGQRSDGTTFITDQTASQVGVVTFNDCRFQNGRDSYAIVGKPNITYAGNRCYFAPVGLVLNTGGHREHWFNSGNTATFTQCFFDQRATPQLGTSDLTGILFSEASSMNSSIVCDRCVLLGIATFTGNLLWTVQGTNSTFQGTLTLTDSAVQRSTNGYFTPNPNLTLSGSVNALTAATITAGNGA